MLLRALAGYEKIWGVQHKLPFDIRYVFALLHKENKQTESAMEQLEIIKQGYTTFLGRDHSTTVEAMKLLNDSKID